MPPAQFIKAPRKVCPAVCPSVRAVAGVKMLRLVGRAARCWGARRAPPGPEWAPRGAQHPMAVQRAW